jgi:hypothetical protein
MGRHLSVIIGSILLLGACKQEPPRSVLDVLTKDSTVEVAADTFAPAVDSLAAEKQKKYLNCVRRIQAMPGYEGYAASTQYVIEKTNCEGYLGR